MDKSFEDELKAIISRHFGSRTLFAAELAAFEQDKNDRVNLSAGTVENRLREDRRGFDNAERSRILELLQARGIGTVAAEPEENEKARQRVAGDYMLFYDLDQELPDGETDVLQGRIFYISPDRDEPSFYDVMRDDNRQTPGQPHSGTLTIMWGYSPTSGLFILNEPDRSSAPTSMLLTWAMVDKAPGEMLMFGQGTGLTGDTYDQTVSARILALPLHWLGKPVPDYFSPTTINADAFDLIAEYLRQAGDSSTRLLKTKPRMIGDNSRSGDLSTRSRKIRQLLQQDFN